MIVQTLRGGHTESILCLDTSLDGCLLSGGENSELCIRKENDESPVRVTGLKEAADVTSIVTSKFASHQAFVSCGAKIVHLDLRRLDNVVEAFEVNDDEINQLALNAKESHLAACDDSGAIQIINLEDNSVQKTLKKHINICSSIAYRPQKENQLFSAGLDSLLIHWDTGKGRSLCQIDANDFGHIPNDNKESYLVNPPFIYSMRVNEQGSLLACGTENALVMIFDISAASPCHLSVLRKHSQGVSQVIFPRNSTRLVSAGNDRKIFIWPEEAYMKADQQNGNAGVGDHENDRAGPVHEVSHVDKINWLHCAAHAGASNVLYFADNSPNVNFVALE